MTQAPPFEQRARPPRRRAGAGRWLLLALAALVVFALGAALGAALENNPSSGGSSTFVRTYAPLPTAPLPRTVTLTVTSP